MVLVSTRVQLPVGSELSLQAERLRAELALVRFVGHVHPAVNAQAGQVGEGFVADVAGEGSVSCVQRGVAVQAGDGEERLAAVRAVVSLLIVSDVSL